MPPVAQRTDEDFIQLSRAVVNELARAVREGRLDEARAIIAGNPVIFAAIAGSPPQ